MKTLVCSSQPSLFLSKSSPWKLKNQTHHHTTLQIPNRHSKTLYPHANAKGFGSNAPANSTIKQKPTNEFSNKDGNGDNEEIPQVVFERMLVRIAVSVGLPMAVGIAVLKFFGVVKEQQLWDVPLWVPFLTTLFFFGTSALGLPYGALSTSWNPDKKGSLLGLEEAQQNWVEIWKEEEDEDKSNIS
ncbi:uncharacterized protein PAM68-like [Ziziphus jujuba]|uniref:Uncharacterized protein PAM68-like n=2 Tax=Ziziphus jujuba TaxID=326968 RepID=A0A6P3ZJ03_ZIZJJ|nr:uncharacterized protein PAM68-like [Ziziphus jujuba]KAH7538103.1 hypothetical protein FEM48_Zijuj03G0163700 [Ziziphus jujuba var. spinosa]